MSEHLNDQEVARREKLKGFAELGIDPYPAAMWEVNATAKEILEAVEKIKTENPGQEIHEVEGYKDISIAGRIMSINAKGKVTFIKIQDKTTRIQLFISIDNVSPGEDKTFYNSVIKHLLDIGDFIGVKGEAFVTKTGETSIRVKELKVLGKALRPLPVVKEKDGEVFDAFADPELRWRQRYVDLVVNSDVKETFLKRTQMIRTIRDFLNDSGAIEVDTPVLQSIPGGAAARPFLTHHNALDIPLYLRIANELYLKRLIVGGFDWVYEFSRNFRNEGMSRKHNPEFTILEFYVAYKDYIWMMDFTERMLEKVATSLHGTSELTVGENKINFQAPFKRITIYDAIKEYTGHDVSAMGESQIYDVCKSLHLEVDKTMGKGKLIDELFSAKCEKNFIQPTFITDYPVEMSPLTKKHRSKEGLVERFELMVNGQEIANAYSELNDPLDQRARFEEQVKLMERGDDEAMFIDHDFLRALEYGMPPTAGIGIGIDRLAMLMTNQATIQEVLFFPQMRPESFE
jgi:lysyl-tRNA synthetase class 2